MKPWKYPGTQKQDKKPNKSKIEWQGCAKNPQKIVKNNKKLTNGLLGQKHLQLQLRPPPTGHLWKFTVVNVVHPVVE